MCENYRHLLPQPECAINSANRRPRSRLKGSRRVKIEKSGTSEETAFDCTLRPHESATRGKRKMADNWQGRNFARFARRSRPGRNRGVGKRDPRPKERGGWRVWEREGRQGDLPRVSRYFSRAPHSRGRAPDIHCTLLHAFITFSATSAYFYFSSAHLRIFVFTVPHMKDEQEKASYTGGRG